MPFDTLCDDFAFRSRRSVQPGELHDALNVVLGASDCVGDRFECATARAVPVMVLTAQLDRLEE
jgi:hypothetical protein